jgi:coniferyl-aldehyde dehydrogenase
MDVANLLQLQREAFHRDIEPNLDARKRRLSRLLRMVEDSSQEIIAAVAADFGHRAHQETRLIDLLMVKGGIKHAKRHLKGWMRQRRLPTALHFLPGRNRLMRQPLGCVGIVAPWNYPLLLSIGPAISALAAGNRVIIKPSELTPRFSELLHRIVAESFEPDLMAVVTGDAKVGEEFVAQPFDHLFFTGSTQIGRVVAQAAARNLTPVTLELGGKSPVIVDRSANLDRAAGAIAFTKLMNAGQTCVAPDYLFVPKELCDAFIGKLLDAADKMYPSVVDNDDFTSIVSQRHFDRLQAMVEDAAGKGARIVTRDTSDSRTRKFPATLILGATAEMRVMQEEIFGPILPVLTYDQPEQAIEHINRHERPLALYWFGSHRGRRAKILGNTISGGVSINDCAWHVAQEDAPFGGVGASGQGAYHGEWGFRTFSKEKPVFHQSILSSLPLLRPPYGKLFDLLLGLVGRII